MFPAGVPDHFEREYGCSEAEWRGWLPAATHPRTREPTGPCALRVGFDDGALALDWLPLPPREIALLRLPRLRVRFRFDGVSEQDRQTFMRSFDRHLQRGGG